MVSRARNSDAAGAPQAPPWQRSDTPRVNKLRSSLTDHVLLLAQPFRYSDARQMVGKIAPTCALCGMMSLLTACRGAPDTPTGPSSAVETPPAPMTGIVQGIVRSEGYFSRSFSRSANFRRASTCDRRARRRADRDHECEPRMPVGIAAGTVPPALVSAGLRTSRQRFGIEPWGRKAAPPVATAVPNVCERDCARNRNATNGLNEPSAHR